MKVDEGSRRTRGREDGQKWLRVCIAHYDFFFFQLKQIEATNAAVRQLFRSHKKAALKG